MAAIVNQGFLDYSGSKGNNLKDAGVKSGMKWCLCAHRWKEAFDAAVNGDISQEAVPKVYLHASHEKALDTVSYSDLKKYEAPREAATSGRRQNEHDSPEGGGGLTSHANELGGDHGTTAP